MVMAHKRFLNDEEPPAEVKGPEAQHLIKLSAQSKESGNRALAEGSHEEAIDLYLRGVQRLELLNLNEHKDGKSLMVALLLNLSLARLRTDDPRRARNAATRALQLDPSSEKGLYRRAEAAFKQADYDTAIGDLTALLSEHSSNREAAKLLHNVQSKQRAYLASCKKQASKMLAPTQRSDDEAEEQDNNPKKNSAENNPHKSSAEYNVGSEFETKLPSSWEAVRDERGNEVWRRKQNTEKEPVSEDNKPYDTENVRSEGSPEAPSDP